MYKSAEYQLTVDECTSIEILIEIANKYKEIGDLRMSLNFIERAHKLSQQVNNVGYILKSQTYIGNIY